LAGGGEEVLHGGVVGAFLGAPADGAAGVVVVPGQDKGAAVPGEHGSEHRRGEGFADPALAVDDGDLAGAWPGLADGLHVPAPRQFRFRRQDLQDGGAR
jgi:hypothetical protein